MGETVLYAGGGVQASQVERGACAILRLSGTCTPELSRWLAASLKGAKRPVAVSAGTLRGADDALARCLLDHAARKLPVALVDPPEALSELLSSAELPVFSAEASILPSGSFPDSLARERLALQELASRFKINPRWRKLDQDGVWLCALCGLEVDAARVRGPFVAPPPALLRGVRRHLLEDCPASRAGRTQPLPAPVLDAFLAEVNQRKLSEREERKRRFERELETMQDLERSIDQAKKRQFHLLPLEPAPDAVAEIAVHYRPLQAVSGDFLDFYDLDGDRFGILIADVSGHGVETAIVLGMAKMAFRLRAGAHSTVRGVVDGVNRDLFPELRRSAFITGVFAAIDRPSRRMSWVRAGHPKTLLRRASGGCEELEGSGLPIGVDRGPRFSAAVEEREVALNPGDVLLFYTDGVIEAGPAGAQFGLERLKEALLKAPLTGSAKEILESVTGAVDGFLAGAPAGDDVTFVCLRVK
jgi:serine phosphatase RsbU (regulator of sigma subunit)